MVVDDDGMLNLVAMDGGANGLARRFVGELGAVYADKRYRIARVFMFEVSKVGQNMHAVDAAIGPKIEDHNLAAQFAAESERSICV